MSFLFFVRSLFGVCKKNCGIVKFSVNKVFSVCKIIKIPEKVGKMLDFVNTISNIIGINVNLFIVLTGIILGIIICAFASHILKKLQNFLKELFKNDGEKFERDCKKILESNGWKIDKTHQSGAGDCGVDIFAEKKGKKVAIQCKHYKNRIAPPAIQEIYTGKDYHKLKPKNQKISDYGIVVYSRKSDSYTKQASDMADVLNIKLLHFTELKKLDKYL